MNCAWGSRGPGLSRIADAVQHRGCARYIAGRLKSGPIWTSSLPPWSVCRLAIPNERRRGVNPVRRHLAELNRETLRPAGHC